MGQRQGVTPFHEGHTDLNTSHMDWSVSRDNMADNPSVSSKDQAWPLGSKSMAVNEGSVLTAAHLAEIQSLSSILIHQLAA